MAKLPTIGEVRKMSAQDIRADVEALRHDSARVRLGVEMNKEKDASKMKKNRRHLARLLTILQEKGSQGNLGKVKGSPKSLSTPSKTSTIPARA